MARVQFGRSANLLHGDRIALRYKVNPLFNKLVIIRLHTHLSNDFSQIKIKTNFLSRYQFYLVAFNKQGRGEQSELINVKTDGALPVAPDKKSALWVNTTLASVRLDAWHHGGCPITAFRVRYRPQSSKQWTQVWPPSAESTLDNGSTSGSLNELNEIGSNPSVSSAQSASSDLFSERSPSESPLIALSATHFEEQRLQLRDLQPGRKYIVQVTASNQVGSTDAEYSFSTFPIMSNELIRSSTKLIGGSTLLIPTGNQLLQLGFLLPVTLCCAALLLLLLLLGALIRKQPSLSGAGSHNGSGPPGTLLYATSGHKEELQLANFTSKQAMAGIGCDSNTLNCSYGFTGPNGNARLGTLLGGDTLVKCDPNTGAANAARVAASGAKVQLMEPLYATVKRTARLARTGNDTHIYSYPIGAAAAAAAAVNNHQMMQHLQSANMCSGASNPYTMDSMSIDTNALDSFARGPSTCESSLACTYASTNAPNGPICGCGSACPQPNSCLKTDQISGQHDSHPDPSANLLQLGMCSMMR
jgi:hypothetical protein